MDNKQVKQLRNVLHVMEN